MERIFFSFHKNEKRTEEKEKLYSRIHEILVPVDGSDALLWFFFLLFLCPFGRPRAFFTLSFHRCSFLFRGTKPSALASLQDVFFLCRTHSLSHTNQPPRSVIIKDERALEEEKSTPLSGVNDDLTLINANAVKRLLVVECFFAVENLLFTSFVSKRSKFSFCYSVIQHARFFSHFTVERQRFKVAVVFSHKNRIK